MKKSCCSACAKGRPCCGTRSNPSKASKTVKLTADQLRSLKNQTSWIVGRIHVGTPDEEVEADIRRRAKKINLSASDTGKLVRHALNAHHKNIKLYNDVMSGRIGRGR